MADPRIAESILHADMDAFFVEVERLEDRTLVGVPVVVGGDGARGVVASASYEARAHGVTSAMPMSRAKRLCPSLRVVPPRHGRYSEVSVEVFSVFGEFTPLVQGQLPDALSSQVFVFIGGELERAFEVRAGGTQLVEQSVPNQRVSKFIPCLALTRRGENQAGGFGRLNRVQCFIGRITQNGEPFEQTAVRFTPRELSPST